MLIILFLLFKNYFILFNYYFIFIFLQKLFFSKSDGITFVEFALILECKCETIGSVHSHCNENSSQCSCKSGFAGLSCDKCASGYFNYPKCECKLFDKNG